MGAFFITAALGLSGYLRHSERQARRALLQHRPNLELRFVYEHFYSQFGFDQDQIISIWREIGRRLHVDPGRLRPTDTFALLRTNYVVFFSDVDEIEDYVRATRGRLRKDSVSLNTIDQVVRFIAECDGDA
jgi:hypothetical protein